MVASVPSFLGGEGDVLASLTAQNRRMDDGSML